MGPSSLAGRGVEGANRNAARDYCREKHFSSIERYPTVEYDCSFTEETVARMGLLSSSELL